MARNYYNAHDLNKLPLCDLAHDWASRFVVGGVTYTPRERIERSIAANKSVPFLSEEIIHLSEGVDALYNALLRGQLLSYERQLNQLWKEAHSLLQAIKRHQNTPEVQGAFGSTIANRFKYPLTTYFRACRLIAGALFLLHHLKAGTAGASLQAVPADTLIGLSPGSSNEIGAVPAISTSHVSARDLSLRPVNGAECEVVVRAYDLFSKPGLGELIQASLERFIHASH